MDSSKILELTHDYLSLLTEEHLHKADYRKRVLMASNTIGGVLRLDNPKRPFGFQDDVDEEQDDEEKQYLLEEREQEKQFLLENFFAYYLSLMARHLSKYLDEKVEPYVCPGSGDSSRNYVIEARDSSLVVKCVGDEPSEARLNHEIKSSFHYPLKVRIERVKSVDGRPTWLPYK